MWYASLEVRVEGWKVHKDVGIVNALIRNVA